GLAVAEREGCLGRAHGQALRAHSIAGAVGGIRLRALLRVAVPRDVRMAWHSTRGDPLDAGPLSLWGTGQADRPRSAECRDDPRDLCPRRKRQEGRTLASDRRDL